MNRYRRAEDTLGLSNSKTYPNHQTLPRTLLEMQNLSSESISTLYLYPRVIHMNIKA